MSRLMYFFLGSRPWSRAFFLLLLLAPLGAYAQSTPPDGVTTGIAGTTSLGGLAGIMEAHNGSVYLTWPGGTCSATQNTCGGILQLTNFLDNNGNLVAPGQSTVFNAYSFNPQTTNGNGNYPLDVIEAPGGYLVGATEYGGASSTDCGYVYGVGYYGFGGGCGTFFYQNGVDLDQPPGADDAFGFQLVHSFTTAEVAAGGGPITLGSDGNYYGSGIGSLTSIWKITPDGNLSMLHKFCNSCSPFLGVYSNQLLEADDGNFYAAASGGGDVFNAVIYQMTPSGSMSVVAQIPSDGSLAGMPIGQLVEGPDEAFYGVSFGGSSGPAAIFRVTKDGKMTILHWFKSDNSEGYPVLSGTPSDTTSGGLILGADGNLYGTMDWGGDLTHCNRGTGYNGCGTLFQVTTTGTFTVLHNFIGGTTDGAHPERLIQYHDGGILVATKGDSITGDPVGTVTYTRVSGLQGPVQLQLYRQSDMSPVTSTDEIDPGTKLVLKWQALNAFSNTMRSCYAHVNSSSSTPSTGFDDWTGKQTGTASGTGYSGQAVVTAPATDGGYGYALVCGGVEAGFVDLTVRPTLAIQTTSLPDATVGKPYSQALQGINGTTPYTWSVASGTLPPGLNFNTGTGAISGTPTQFGTYALTFQLQDSSNPAQKVTASLVIKVDTSFAISTASLPNGVVGTSYSQTLAAVNGIAPYTWKLTSGTLPNGLSFDASTGVLSGTPTAAGTVTLGFSVSDAENPAATASATLTLKISPAPLKITTTSIPSGVYGSAYTTTLTATGGTPPYTWGYNEGSTPIGLSIDPNTGVLSGKPIQWTKGTEVTVAVEDSSDPHSDVSATFTLVVKSDFSFASSIVAAGTTYTCGTDAGKVSETYFSNLCAQGGANPYNFSLVSGSLPPGVTLTSNVANEDPNVYFGALRGTPTQAGTYNFTVQASDSERIPATDTQAFTIVVSPQQYPTTTTLTTSNPAAGVGESVTLSATVTSKGATPTGIVTFMNGSTTLGTATLNAQGVATLNTSFRSTGSDSITAEYGGDAQSLGSTSNAVAETVVTVGVTAGLAPGTLTIQSGQSGTLVITLTPTGGYTGTVSFSCGTLPANVACAFAPSSVTIAAGSGPVTDTLTVSTSGNHASAALARPATPWSAGGLAAAASLWLPGFTLALFGRRGAKKRLLGGAFELVLMLAGFSAMSGCAGHPDAKPGNYTVPITISLGEGSTQSVNAYITIQ